VLLVGCLGFSGKGKRLGGRNRHWDRQQEVEEVKETIPLHGENALVNQNQAHQRGRSRGGKFECELQKGGTAVQRQERSEKRGGLHSEEKRGIPTRIPWEVEVNEENTIAGGEEGWRSLHLLQENKISAKPSGSGEENVEGEQKRENQTRGAGSNTLILGREELTVWVQNNGLLVGRRSEVTAIRLGRKIALLMPWGAVGGPHWRFVSDPT